ncbi:MAG: hypothetical protein E4H02_04265, partial [Lentisphaerales bacterium]
ANDRETILKQADESLTRLKTDRIDLLLLHRPNPDIPIEESLSAPGYSPIAIRGSSRPRLNIHVLFFAFCAFSLHIGRLTEQ